MSTTYTIGTTKTGTKIHRVDSLGRAACGTESAVTRIGSVRGRTHGYITRTQQQPVGTTPEGATCSRCFADATAPVVASVAAAPVSETEREIARLEKEIEIARFYVRRETRGKTAKNIAFLEAKIADLRSSVR
jgi:signal transduction protein with GAF and PtsI domain